MVSGDPSVVLTAIRRIKAVTCDWCREDSAFSESSFIVTASFRSLRSRYCRCVALISNPFSLLFVVHGRGADLLTTRVGAARGDSTAAAIFRQGDATHQSNLAALLTS